MRNYAAYLFAFLDEFWNMRGKALKWAFKRLKLRPRPGAGRGRRGAARRLLNLELICMNYHQYRKAIEANIGIARL